MKTKLSLVLVLCALVSFNAVAQEKKIKDKRTNPDLFFLEESEVANSLQLLPAPPDTTDILFKYDQARYQWGKTQRGTDRGEQAFLDARVGGDGVPKAFSEAFGTEITKEKTPEIYKIVTNMREDAGDLATRAAKVYYNRTRPFKYYNEDTCNPEQQKELSTNGSYPSGHTTIGWATALVLAEINPARQNEILKRGFEMGQSRVICGYHFQSDVDAARLVAGAVVARLHANDAFNAQLSKAKEEFQKLNNSKGGSIQQAKPVEQPIQKAAPAEPAQKVATVETLKVTPTGTILLDGGLFSSDNKEFVNGATMPDIRLGAKASFGSLNGKVDIGFAYGIVSLKDIFVEKVFSPTSLIRLGYFVHQYGLQSATSSVEKITMEEPGSNTVFFNDRLIGAMYIHNKNDFFGAASVHVENAAITNNSTVLGKTGYGAMTRLIYRPLRTEGSIFHVGLSGGYETPRYNTKPELSHSSFTLSTNFPSRVSKVKAVEAKITDAKYLVKFTPELLFAYGRIGFETQYFYLSANRNDLPKYTASGAYGIVRAILKGGNYKYNSNDSGIATPAPGSLEMTLGYNYTDMSDDKSNILGGRLKDLAVCLNYYINKYMVCRIRYTNASVTDRTGVENQNLNAIQARLQMRF